jgi:MinD-like ATPase involved in chromosome partitioning or flagellar assembly
MTGGDNALAEDRRDRAAEHKSATADSAEPKGTPDAGAVAPLAIDGSPESDIGGYPPDDEPAGHDNGGSSGLAALFGPRYDGEPVDQPIEPGIEMDEATPGLPDVAAAVPETPSSGEVAVSGPPDAGRTAEADVRPAGPGGRPAHARTRVFRTMRRATDVAPAAARYTVEGWQRRDQGGRDAAEQVSPGMLFPARRRAPSRGWRRGLYQLSGGLIQVPTSPAEVRRREMIGRARTPVASGHYRVAVLSMKGGVGKTVTTVGLGSTLASVRGDRVIAIDASPGRGTLADKLATPTTATIRDLLDNRAQVSRYADVRRFTSQNANRLEVLASDQDPTVSSALGEDEYESLCAVIERFYSICLTDCGTGLMYSAMPGVLRLADQIVLVSSASVDGARSAVATMDWLAAHGYADLVRSGVVVLTAVRSRRRAAVDLDVLQQHFAARCRAVTSIPYDPYIEQGAEVELEQMRRSTADAYLELAAIIGDRFAERRVWDSNPR